MADELAWTDRQRERERERERDRERQTDREREREGGTVGSDVTLRENWSVFIRCRTLPVGAALVL